MIATVKDAMSIPGAVRAACAGLLVVGAARAQVPMTSQLVASGFHRPLQVAHAPGDPGRIFVVEKYGLIRVVQGGSVLPVPFLDLTAIVNASTIEFGLLALCFDPGYATNGFFYVNYTAGANGDTNVARYQVGSDPNVADPGSRQTVLFLPASTPNHRAGWLGFGADGYLYLAQGDGGPQEDPFNHAQDLALLHGKILRLDVSGDDFPADPDRNYRIPPSNPFVGIGGAPEVFALGLRNPWRCSFDRATSDLWIGDVGEYEREEVDVLRAGTSGQNFGWRCTEGTSCTIWGGCVCGSPALTAPIHDYPHTVGRAVTCGYVYRGSAIPGLQGAFLFGDYQSGRLWTLRWNGTSVTELVERTSELDPPGALDIAHPASFGEDAQGELYVCDYLDGEVFRFVPAPDPWVYCAGDGSGTPCPCGNVGGTGSGCPSSINPNGASLRHSGTPSLSADTLNLLGTGLSNSTVTFFQGTTLINGGLGAVFGDGLRCVGGSVVRLGAVAAASGAAQYPSGQAPPVSVGGMVPAPGSQRTYQVWYRNAAPFCQAETFNLTNGLFVVWAP